ncbi:hypothetical protein P171DRAFT_485401 [Karstenula rhodostoma CBS 690.94]|uniref:BTB domain-containing protein n=1 Tax=Karstenula rhodostoma CBS 690.94 TaxID=1392251 RepID=A0A9P4UCA5_9PLEO|nr:hypothetical protein P171DRAFT_485401 [Karstenula rhodostoma CBS 690.94]
MANTNYILPVLGNEFVTVVVGTGDERKSFALHKSVVCKRSEFFHASLCGDWKESHADKIELPEDDPDIFQLYNQSLYVGNVHQAEPDESSQSKYHYLGQLYVFADKMINVQAKNHVTEAIFHRLKASVIPINHDVCDELADMITMIWNVTSQDAPVRQLLIHSIADFRALYSDSPPPQPLGQIDRLSRTPSEFLSLVVATLIRKRSYRANYGTMIHPGQLQLIEYLEKIP